ncbi:leucine-responsive regulatory protein [Bergeriella denitrificans]|uniref:Leucine-responsive regulatory protein n=2 Tax=Bergeriella denitrificans TaxID=494 RepID=A0A378UFS6_BERDE|nr:Lrp/AsnC family transcriptional regulator [Bergeriella denitrificans]STZ75351.1 leucine-responsive regulatory protein [Bergeriella denitrificans]
MELDKLDRAILNMLQSDATVSLKTLAEAVHSSPATCQRRIAALTENGVIVRQTAQVSPPKVGFSISVFVHIELERQHHSVQEAFERAMQREARVAGCWEISGDYDFLLLVHAEDMAAYHALTRRLFTADNHVRTFKSQFVMNAAKAETKISL